ncbi:MAG: ParB/RepB/Spo0J family partition protein [Pyrinomonadaceae bacterium]
MRHDSHYVEELARTHRTVGRVIPINQIQPNPEQPRVEIGDLTELSNSVREKGVLEPLLVKPNRQNGTWMIIAGERRWRAANLAGLKEVPCIELDIDEKSIAEIALIENLQRKDLTLWEEADGLKFLADRFGYKHEEIAKKISKSRTTVTELLTVAGLPESIRQKCISSNINAKSNLLEIARQFDERAMHKFVDTIQNQSLSRKEIRQVARPHLKDQGLAAQTEPQRTDNLTNNQIFQFKGQGFSLDVKFSNKSDYNKQDIIGALKSALKALGG